MLDIACCKTCGRPYHVPPLLTGVNGPVIFRALERRPQGMTIYQLGAVVYAGVSNEPELWARSLRTTICNMNKRIRQYGWQVKADHKGHGAVYRLIGVPR